VTLSGLAATLALLAGDAYAVDTCGGQTSVANPLPCCSNGGNCTWWAWKKARDSGWYAIPTGNAYTWNDTALQSPAYKVSASPTVGAVAVKEIATGYPLGHVGWVTGLVKNSAGAVTAVKTSQMACGGAYGVTYLDRPIGYYTSYITKVYLNGKAASLCSDGKAVATSSDPTGNLLQVMWSQRCQTTWAKITPKNASAAVSVSIRRQSDGLTLSASGTGTKTSPMIETGATIAGCANGTVSGAALPQVCK
jgi:surface antigen